MWEFIILGLLPGTSIEITFYMWLWIISLVAATYLGRYLRSVHAAEIVLIAMIIMLQSRPRNRRLQA